VSSEERQRELREAGSEPAEAEKQESAKAAKEAKGKERAAEKAAASSARAEADAPADEESGRPKTPRRRRRKAAAEQAEGAEEAKQETAETAPRRRRRKPAAEEGVEQEAAAEAAKQEADEAEAEAEAAEAQGEPEPEDEQAKPKRSPRRGAEVVAGTTRRAAPPRAPDGAVTVRARAKYVRCAPRKARLVIDHIRGKPVDEARAILTHTPRAAARDVLKLLDSAVANAENNHELVADELTVGKAYVDEGPTLKRYRPRALGRATRIRKRTSHMTIELTHKE